MVLDGCTEKRNSSTHKHSCRHTFSNLLKNVSGSDRDKADLMGHRDYITTKRIYQSAEILAKKAITDRI